MRAVVDPNVLMSALLSPEGSPARVLRAWLKGSFELVVSDQLLAELERSLAYPKLRSRVEPSETIEFQELLRRNGRVVDDPDNSPSIHSPDRGDDYLIALAETAHAAIVSGERRLLGLAGHGLILSPSDFLADLARRS